jgi:quercetin dioxygenase-like cupin family protein
LEKAILEETMALTMLEKTSDHADISAWPPAIAAEFERERANNNPCVGTELLSESERTRVWIIRLQPGERVGFHRHVLDYFWTCVTGGRGRQHVNDGKTVEYTYAPGETRHESYAAGEFKVHDLENIGDKDMVFMTVEFLDAPTSRWRFPHGCGPRPKVPPILLQTSCGRVCRLARNKTGFGGAQGGGWSFRSIF